LPDTGDRRPPQQDEIIKSSDGNLMWKTPATLRPTLMEDAIERAKQSHDKEAARLLYVALTRAEKWLIVCASGDVKETGESWYRQVEGGMLAAKANQIGTPAGQGLRIQHGVWREAGSFESPKARQETFQLPNWSQSRADFPGTTQAPISPSDMPGAKSLAGELEIHPGEDAAIRGNNIHLLLEHLPNRAKSDWRQMARQLLPNLSIPEFDAILAETAAVITNPQLAHIFDADALVEVSVSAAIPDLKGQRIRGTIDRLIVSPNQVLIVDFKSNRLIPATAGETPVGILRQMAVYLGAIKSLYPDREISMAIVWTYSASLMPLPHDTVREALQTSPHLDVSSPRP
jgi:ATP-dependent helicase/nuclease subunit A